MKLTRKDFLRLCGLGLLALAGRKAVRAVSEAAATANTPTAATTPRTPRRWGMVIDLQKCRQEGGCTDCVKACTRAHNIPQFADRQHEVKWIWNQPFETVFPQAQTDYTRQEYAGHPIALLCNHCANPPCVRVCPTQATWKREDDGIVMMDWHRCIGCRYCMAACPYHARYFNWWDPAWPAGMEKTLNPDVAPRMRGVVEKCNFCHGRRHAAQDAGVADYTPACAEACPTGAIRFVDLNAQAPDSLHFRLLERLGTDPKIYYRSRKEWVRRLAERRGPEEARRG